MESSIMDALSLYHPMCLIDLLLTLGNNTITIAGHIRIKSTNKGQPTKQNKGIREHQNFNAENPRCESKKPCVVQTKEIAPL
jgi:hypothetical protein